MLESLITAFVVYFVVIDPIGTLPLYLALTSSQNARQRRRTAIEACFVAAIILIVFALIGQALLNYLGISLIALKLAGGFILFLLALEMLTAKRQKRKKDETESLDFDPADSVSIYPLAIPLLAGPSAIASVIVLSGELGGGWLGLGLNVIAISAVMGFSLVVYFLGSMGQRFIHEGIFEVGSRIIAIILAALAVQYFLDGLQELGLLQVPLI